MGSDSKQVGCPDGLTRREWEVLQQVLQGCTNKEAAHALFCSQRTVEFHLRQIYRKLNVRNRLQAMRAVVSVRMLQNQEIGERKTRLA